MFINIIFAVCAIYFSVVQSDILIGIIGIIWGIMPLVMWYISKEKTEIKPIEKLDKNDQDYLLEIGEKTWNFFKKYLNNACVL